MSIANEFNALNGMVVTRKDLEKLLEKAEKERHTIISKRVIRVLEAFKDDTFLIEIKNLVEPYGLNGVDTDDVTGLLGGLEFVPESKDIGLGKPVSPNEIYDMVTQRMIDLIKDANKGDYKRAWKEEGYLIPYNFVSKKAYRGVNVVMLSPLFGLLDNPYFLTFNQIQEKGGKIRKGSHGHKVVYFSSFTKEYSDAEIERLNEKIIDNKLEKGDEKTIFFLKYYNVFNGADIEGIDFDLDNFSLQGKVVNNEIETGENDKIEIAEAIVKNYPKPQPEIKFSGSKAFYRPENDFLSMPDISKFKTSQDFYRTLFHELSHSTGHQSRLNRPFNNPFGTPEYAFEELIAEFGAVFLSAQSGIIFYTNKNHAGYLKGWNEVLLPNLENDNRFLMRASSQAQKLSDYILQPDAKGDFLFARNSKKMKVKKEVSTKKEPVANKIVKKEVATKKEPVANKIVKKTAVATKKEPIASVKKPVEKTPATLDFTKKYGVKIEELVLQANHLKLISLLGLYDVLTRKDNKNAIENGKATQTQFYKDFILECYDKKLSLTKKIQLYDGEHIEFDLDTIELAKSPKLNKTGIDSLQIIAGNDDLRPIMKGVFVDEGKLIATDAHKLVILNAPDQAKNNGKVLNLNSKENAKYSDLIDGIGGRYPNYKAILPNYSQDGKTIDIRNLMNHCYTFISLMKQTYAKQLKFYALSDGKDFTVYFNPKFLLDTLMVFEANGAKKVTLKAEENNRAMMIYTDNGNLGLIMPILYGEKLAVFKTKPLSVLQTPSQKGLKGVFQKDLFAVVKKGLNAPNVNTKKVSKEQERVTHDDNLNRQPKGLKNKDTLAYKMANKPKDVLFFKIEDKHIAEFLGEVERKNKESVVISLTGGQGSMKTRMAFQFMNGLAQNYKVGHASIEEHPESNLYFDKAEQYLNAKALNNIEAPEVKSVQQLERLIKKNDVIVIDSFTKMQEIYKGFEIDKDLRKKYNGKLFIVIFQQTTDGKMRGGSKSQFDADIVLFTEKKDDYRENYIYADKNRYQNKPLDGLKFNIFNKKLQGNIPEATAEPTEKRKLSFSVN